MPASFRCAPVISCILLLVWCVLPAFAHTDDAFALIAQAIAAKHRLSFTARQQILMVPVVSAHDGGTAAPIKIVADVLQAGRKVRMTYLLPKSAAHRVVVDDGAEVRQWEPTQHVILTHPAMDESPATRQKMLALLHRNYRCLRQGRADVNGFPCDVVTMRPRPGHLGPRRVLWIERRRHAILRMEEFDTRGIRRYLSSYQTFQYHTWIPDSRFALPHGMRTCPVGSAERPVAGPQAAFAAAKIDGRIPAWLPAGFSPVGASISVRPDGAQTAVLHYGDGMKMVSVFETAESAQDAPISTPRRATGIQVWPGAAGSLRLVVTGDNTLPADVGREMLTALRPQNAAALRHSLIAKWGMPALPLTRSLRRQGWGYDHIMAICLCLKAQHRRWNVSPQPKPSAAMERQARRWVTETLGH